MSLVNTMLEDLDRRQAGTGAAAANALGFLAPPPPRPRSALGRTVLLALTLLVVAALAWRYAPLLSDRLATLEGPVTPAVGVETAVAALPAPVVRRPEPAPVQRDVPVAAGQPVQSVAPEPAVAEPPAAAPAAVPIPAPPAPVRAEPVTPAAPADSAFERSFDALQERRRAIRELLQAQRYEAAHFDLEDARAQWPDDRGLALLEVRTLLGLRRDAQALAAAEVLGGDLADTATLELLAVARQRNGLHREAASAWASLTRLDEARGDWWFGLAVSLDAAADRSRALTAYRRALGGAELEPALREYARQRLVQLAAAGR